MSSYSPSKRFGPFQRLTRRVPVNLNFLKEEWHNKLNKHLITALRSRAIVSEAINAYEALQRLAPTYPGPALSAIICTDSAITRSEKEVYSDEEETEEDREPDGPHPFVEVLTCLVAFMRAGGTVVLAGQFSNHFSDAAATRLFGEVCGLPWRLGEYHRSTFAPNRAFDIPALPLAALPASYNTKTLHAKDVPPAHALYYPAEGAQVTSLVFPSRPAENTEETPAAFGPVGDGYLGYIGDVNHEEKTTDVIVAMCGLAGGAARKAGPAAGRGDACWWFGCDGQGDANKMQRCTACKQANYCGARCQQRFVVRVLRIGKKLTGMGRPFRDWTKGGHRQECAILKEAHTP